MCASKYVDDYDDDGLDEDYGGDFEGMSPEDEAAMTEATAQVRKSLGKNANRISLGNIQDILWHYYYDVDKTVTYLNANYIAPLEKSTQKPVAPKKTSEDGGRPCSAGRPVFPVVAKSDLSYRSFFDDMPWLGTPQDRQAVFIEPWRPRGGLLGGGTQGTAGMSKLQKLAAARKKKNDEKKENDKTGQVQEGFSKLAISEASAKEDRRPVASLAKRQKLSSGFRASAQQAHDTPECEVEDLGNQGGKESTVVPSRHPGDESDQAAEMAPVRASPSAFARTLFGSAPEPKTTGWDVLPMPYTSSSSFSAKIFSEPSPDDIVLAAQSKAGKKNQASANSAKNDVKSEAGSAADQAASGMSKLNISDVPMPKSKGIDVVKEFESSSGKRSVSFVVVGHVDAGKSTLMGRLLMDLKFVEKRTVDKYRKQGEKIGKQSFALAWVMDQRTEERDRGVTMDIATNYFETDKTKFTILDAPGHRDFIPNMIAGASQADFAILVIDASTGEYERGLKGQTREHILLLRSLGVQRIVVAVNKLDTVGWSSERFNEISEGVTGFLYGLGFQEKQVTFIPISGLKGDNIISPIENPAASWYTGSTLIDALEASGPSAARALKKPLRMSISEIFRSLQQMTTLSGRIDAGTLQVGDVLVVQPAAQTAYIKSITVDNQTHDWAVAGQNMNITLTNIDPAYLNVGDILCHPTDAISCGHSFVMKAMAFDHLLPSPIDIHRGRLHAAGQIHTMLATLDKATGEVVKKKPKIVQPGEVARVGIKLDHKVPLEAGQRVVIRSGGETIAAGLVES